ncbi:MAG TPA: response regulator [Bryobacteraceae bacterium]|jgi:DNA-binding NarL/FixJ family response regulator
MKLRAVVADDHSIVVAGLKHVLQEISVDVLATVVNGRDLVSAADTLKPDIVILDISMPVLTGSKQRARFVPKIRRQSYYS